MLDATARKYLRVAAHSDIATELHLTNGLNGLKNFLMDVDGYITLYSIVRGIECLSRALIPRLQNPPEPNTPAIRFVCNSPVMKVGQNTDGRYRLLVRRQGCLEPYDFDVVVLALSYNWLRR